MDGARLRPPPALSPYSVFTFCEYFFPVKLALATVAAFVALGAAAPAHASTPVPWCGFDSSDVDRLPDATQAFAVHVAYVRAPGAPDRFAEWAPRIVGDVAAIDAWWRREDPARTLRFDFFPFSGCGSVFGALDLTHVALPVDVSGIGGAFSELRNLLASEVGFQELEKTYLVYFDGATGQGSSEQVCGQGATPGFVFPGIAIVYLDACGLSQHDSRRSVVAVHELVHTLGAVDDAAPNACQDGHVCDVATDLLTASLSGNALELHVLDGNRDDYYGHAGRWADVRNSFFLERLDAPDRTPPATPSLLRAGEDPSGLTRFSWRAAGDDVGPVTYRVYQDRRLVRQTSATSILLGSNAEGNTQYSVRAVDGVGRLSPVVSARFRDGVGMVTATGRLVRDTVRPPAISRVAVRRTATTVVLSWPAVRDPGGIRNYRVKSAGRTFFVRKPAVAISLSRLRTAVTINPVDRAGNIGPATVVPLRRLR